MTKYSAIKITIAVPPLMPNSFHIIQSSKFKFLSFKNWNFYLCCHVIKWAVKNGVKEAYKDITGKKPVEDEKNEKELEGLVNDSKDAKI